MSLVKAISVRAKEKLRVLLILNPEITVTEVSHWFDQCDSKRFDR
jgi:hypothetical protein